eukprot:1008040-Rhodomonas_salina.1
MASITIAIDIGVPVAMLVFSVATSKLFAIVHAWPSEPGRLTPSLMIVINAHTRMFSQKDSSVVNTFCAASSCSFNLRSTSLTLTITLPLTARPNAAVSL